MLKSSSMKCQSWNLAPKHFSLLNNLTLRTLWQRKVETTRNKLPGQWMEKLWVRLWRSRILCRCHWSLESSRQNPCRKKVCLNSKASKETSNESYSWKIISLANNSKILKQCCDIRKTIETYIPDCNVGIDVSQQTRGSLHSMGIPAWSKGHIWRHSPASTTSIQPYILLWYRCTTVYSQE